MFEGFIAVIFWGWVLAMLIGLALHFILAWKHSEKQIEWSEYITGGLIMCIFLFPIAIKQAEKMAISNNLTFNEQWNGWELPPGVSPITCSEDGPCANTYSCDEHKVVDQEAYTDKDGTYHSEESHQQSEACPYTTVEYSFVVPTTVGDYHEWNNWLPDDPESYRWKKRGEYTGLTEWRHHSVPSSAPRGTPPFWAAVKNRIDIGDPGQVTAEKTYTNYILASQYTSLHKYSADIAKYQKAGVIPELRHDIHNLYYLDRTYFAGVSAPDVVRWQILLGRLDAAFGHNLTGNLYVVIVPAGAITEPDEYVLALGAYWQSPAYGKDALSKNALVLILGTGDGANITWARAFTGMPMGNEMLLSDLRDKLKGQPLNADVLFGYPKAQITGGASVTDIDLTSGVLGQILWGQHKFARVHMRDYHYLKLDVQPTDSQYHWMILIEVGISLVVWLICIFADIPAMIHEFVRTHFRRRSNSWR